MSDIPLDYIPDSSLEEVVIANDSVTVVPPNDLHPDATTDRTRTHAGEAGSSVDSQLETRLRALAASGAEPATRPNDATPTPFHRTLPPKYQFVRTLGRGGMGEVILATDTALHRNVALKFMHQKAAHSPHARRRFEKEARVLAQLKHPNIVTVHEWGEFEGEPYFAMAYLDGLSLHERRGEYRVSAGRAVGLMARIAAGLHHAHENGVFHRDLKASNVMFSDGHPVITDFGCAKFDDGEQSTQGYALLGTPSHMAPEVLEQGSKEYDARGDVFSLGVMLFRLLAGEGPFGDDPPPGFPRNRVRAEDPPAVRDCIDAVPGVDDRLEAIVRNALAKTPSDRYQTAAEFAAELEAWAATAPAVEKPKRRKRWWLVAAAAVLIGCGSVAAVTLWKNTGGDPKEVKRTVAERLADGETVQLITEGGDFAERPSQPPGFDQGSIQETPQGSVLSAGQITCFDLVNETIAVPYRFSARVRHTMENDGSRTGIYALRKEHSQKKGFAHSMVTIYYNAAASVSPSSVGTVGSVWAGTAWVSPSAYDTPFVPVSEMGSRKIPRLRNAKPNEEEEFHLLEIEVWPNQTAACFNSQSFRLSLRLSDEEAAISWNAALRKEVYNPPLSGHGLGVFVVQGNALIRDAQLIPLASPSITK